MNLYAKLVRRAENGKAIRVGLVGAGKFGTMFLSQALRTPGLHVVGVSDLDPDRARAALLQTGWPAERFCAPDAKRARKSGLTWVTDDTEGLIKGGIDILIEATGSPEAGIAHARLAIKQGVHLLMVNVEADALAGPLLAERARKAGLVYSLAYGDQPALIAEQVDWARAIGLSVVAAGKGTLYMPSFHKSTPGTVWKHYGIDAERAAASGMNAKMFNSFLDGTKSAIEMAAVANACGLSAPEDGLSFPAVPVEELAQQLIPKADGGVLAAKGMVEVVSSRTRRGQNLENDLRWGTYVTFEAPTDYVRACFKDYGLITDAGGSYSALWRPYHLIGLELGLSVASIGLRGEPTGAPRSFRADVVATAKKNLSAGRVLDGEGGYCVYGKLMPARRSLEIGALPLGLASGVKLNRAVKAGEVISLADVTTPDSGLHAEALKFRLKMEERIGADA
ncbi:MAG: NAD(P)H-dependent oxidoreductase [Magnetovibrionaceae bacterium]